MSLLLDALKKAALEKQRREQSFTKEPSQDEIANDNAEKTAAPDASKNNLATEATNDEEKIESTAGQTNKIASAETLLEETRLEKAPLEKSPLEEAPLEEAPLEFDLDAIDDNYRLVMESEQSAEKKAEQATKLEETIEELTVAPITADEEEFIIDEALIEKSLQEATAQAHALKSQSSPTKISTVTTEKTESPPAQPVPAEASQQAAVAIAAPIIPSSTQPVTESHIAHFNAHSGKDALNKLLSRSNQAAKNARKRMIVIYALLTLTSVTLVGLYYYLLSSGGTMSHPVATKSVATEEVVVDADEQEEPQAYVDDEAALVTAALVTEDTAAITDESDDRTIDALPTAANDINAQDNTATPAPTPASMRAMTVANATSVTQKNKTQTARTVETKNSRTAATDNSVTKSVSLPVEQPPKQAIITRQAAVDGISESISRGYQAYQAGDFEMAESAYREALAEDPHQRDALLGAAAVAVQLNRHEEALRFYQQRLARAPKDEYAQAGVLALTTSSENNPQFDTELNRLLREYPNAAHLHFLKGSLYASRQQWGAAQLSFFEAWQRNNKNPDYAFNLAVAMDHIQEPKEAIRFYQQALSLSGGHQVGFSMNAVQQRVQELEQQ